VQAKERGDILLFEIDEALATAQLFLTLDVLQLGPTQVEVLASLVTSSDNGGIELPEYVLKLIRRTQCGVGFSFVDVGPDAPDRRGDGATTQQNP
jgi:hypothetical protein